MTTDTQSKTAPSVAIAAARFAAGGFVGCLALAATLGLGGVLALTVPPLTSFAGAFWARGNCISASVGDSDSALRSPWARLARFWPW